MRIATKEEIMWMTTAILAAAILLFSLLAIDLVEAVTLTCSFQSNCTNTSLFYLMNDTGGYLNAHAQVATNGSYNYSFCCNATITINALCPGNATLINLSGVTNAHAQISNSSAQNYTAARACISSNETNTSVRYTNGSCPSTHTTLFSLSNETNAHISTPNYYGWNVCANITDLPPTSGGGGGGGASGGTLQTDKLRCRENEKLINFKNETVCVECRGEIIIKDGKIYCASEDGLLQVQSTTPLPSGGFTVFGYKLSPLLMILAFISASGLLFVMVKRGKNNG